MVSYSALDLGKIEFGKNPSLDSPQILLPDHSLFSTIGFCSLL